MMPPFAPLSSPTSPNNTNISSRMAGKGTFHVEVENDLRGCAILLKSVVCEWLLIFFLLVDAVYLYFLKKLARYCDLQLPCILCSRLDHIFGNEKPDFYKDLICNDHRSKLSSLVYCHSHGSLADVHDVCEECLLSFAMKKDSSPEIYKFLIGKLGLDGLRNPASEMDFFHGFVSVKSCSCCNKQWRCRPSVQKLVKAQSFGSRAPKPNNIPLPSTPQQKPFNHRDAVVKARDRISVSPAATPPVSGFPDSDPMAQVGYSKLKISSHSESDFIFSEEDGGHEHSEYDKLDRFDQQGPGYSFKKQFEDCFTTKKVISPTKIPSDVPRPQTQQPKFSPSQPELVSKPVKESQDSKEGHSLGQRFSSSRVSTQPPSPSKPSLDKDDKADGDVETWEAFDLITPKSGERDDDDKKDGISITGFHTGYRQTSKHPNVADSLGKASGLPPDRNEISQRTQVSSSDDKADLPFRFKVNGYVDEPYNPSTDSLGKVSGLPPDRNEISKRAQVSSSDDKADLPFRFKVNGYVDEPYKDIKVSQKPTSLERSDSNLSLSELSVVDKIGEDQKLIAQLRKQIEEDKECIEGLREELEEERSASAEAANQAMAMITKLQEEKAVLNMDAQQYLRMMEEQAEHDVEALDRANDLLTEKEKEIQDLEAELDYYRMKYPDDYEEELAQFAS